MTLLRNGSIAVLLAILALIGVSASSAGAADSPWSEPVRLTGSHDWQAHVVHPNGRVTVAWASDGRLHYRDLEADGTLQSSKLLRGQRHSYQGLALASLPHGATLAVWVEDHDDPATHHPYDRDVVARRIGATGALGPVIRLGSGITYNPVVDTDSSGRALVAWRSSDPANHVIRVEGRVIGGPGAGATIPLSRWRPAIGSLDVVSGTSNHVVAVWSETQFDGSEPRLRGRRLAPDGAIGPDTLLSAIGKDAGSAFPGPTLSVDGRGRSRVFYVTKEGGNHIAVRRDWRPGEPPGPQHRIGVHVGAMAANEDGWNIIGPGRRVRYLRPDGSPLPWIDTGRSIDRIALADDRTALIAFDVGGDIRTRTVHPNGDVDDAAIASSQGGSPDLQLTENGRAVIVTSSRGVWVTHRRFDH